MTRRVGVVGATGYVGSEVCRMVLGHPDLELAAVTSGSKSGIRLGDAVPGLFGATDLVISSIEAGALDGLDVVILATPHGAAKDIVGKIGSTPVIVDCSADHRHAPGWVYGQPEWKAEALRGATRIAAPGCFASALLLGIAPFVASGTVAGPVHSVGATGSTGSGAAPSAGTHHPERFVNLKAYKVLSHQHVPEVRTFLAGLGDAPPLAFVPLSAPLDRGIFVTSFIPVVPGTNAATVVADAYAGQRLVRIRKDSPEVRWVRGTAHCDVSVHQDGDTAVVLTAIDNLGRGAATQAVQALNVALGFEPWRGLPLVPATP